MMNAADLVLRCYIKKEQDHFVAVCIDLCLAAQGESIQDARQKLDAQIRGYVEEALTVDSEYADQLLNRKAPFSQRAYFHWILARLLIKHKLLSWLGRTNTQEDKEQAFKEAMPMKPA